MHLSDRKRGHWAGNACCACNAAAGRAAGCWLTGNCLNMCASEQGPFTLLYSKQLCLRVSRTASGGILTECARPRRSILTASRCAGVVLRYTDAPVSEMLEISRWRPTIGRTGYAQRLSGYARPVPKVRESLKYVRKWPGKLNTLRSNEDNASAAGRNSVIRWML